MAHVLVVEDQPSVSALVRHHLESAGFQASSASNVTDGWRLVRDFTPDLAVVDLRFPDGVSGWKLIESIRQNDRLASMPVIVLTGMIDAEVIEKARELRCHYLNKPFEAKELIRRVQDLVAAHAASSDHERAAAPVPVVEADAQQAVTYAAAGATTISVGLLLPGHRIHGKVRDPGMGGGGIEAAIAASEGPFIEVADARILTADGEREIGGAGSVHVKKAEIIAFYPLA